MTCQPCIAAQTNPNAGLSDHQAGCYGCRVRHFSAEPPFAIRAEYERINDPAELAKFKLDLRAEFDRRQALRKAMT
jgi:hypothetical protein